MDVSDRVRTLVEEVPSPPPGDAAAVFQRGRRRRRRRRAGGAAVAGAVVAAAVVMVVVVLPTGEVAQLPPIGDLPEQEEVTIPDGWVTITAGEIAVSIPPDWEIQSRSFDESALPEGARSGGPCPDDLYRPLPGLQPAEGPVAVVYDVPTDGYCTMIGHTGPPPWPGLVLYETVRDGDGRPGQDRRNMAEHGERDRIGQLEVWRSVDEPPADLEFEPTRIMTYVAVEFMGGIWVSHPDDPIVQQILATARPAETWADARP